MPIRASRWIASMALRRAVTLALCLVVLAAIARPQHVEAHEAQLPGISAIASLDLASIPDQDHGAPAQHCTHCGCGIHAADFESAQRLTAFRPALRFTAGAQSRPEPSPVLNPRPPRA